jgi:predicted RNA-binding protein
MTTFIDVYSAAWVLLKGHRVSAIDVLRITQVLKGHRVSAIDVLRITQEP